jgi:hypothetical protein
MKTFKLLLGILISFSFFSQTERYIRLSEISMVTPNRDTLFLINDDLGRRILSTWDIALISPKDRPTILLVTEFPSYTIASAGSKRSRRKNK